MSPLTSPRAIRAFAYGSLMMTDAADVFAAFRSEVVSQTPLQGRDHRRLPAPGA